MWTDVLAPACLSVDHPRYLSFIPNAPTKAAAAFDMLVGASSVYGGSWLEGSGAVYAENQALRWLADLAGMPRRPAGHSSRAGRSATFPRWWPRGSRPSCAATRRRPAGPSA